MPYNNGTPLISVLVAVYNVEQYLKHCIDSILNQTYKNLEIILVDDCSTDKSGQICDNYAKKDSRVKVIHHKKNECLSGVRNTGIINATGELVSFIDADDYIDPDFYDYLLSIMKRNDMKPDITAHSEKLMIMDNLSLSQKIPIQTILNYLTVKKKQ